MKMSTRTRKQARPKRERYFGQPMDRGKQYRPKYLCFKCRRVIRVSRIGTSNAALSCGNCGGVAYPIGPMFKAPPANTNRGKRAWTKIEREYSRRSKFYAEKRYRVYKDQ